MRTAVVFVCLCVAASAQATKTLQPHSDDIHAIAFSPDSKLMASASKDIKLTDTKTWQVKTVLGSHNDYVGALAFSPDGKILASGGWDRVIKLWDVETGKELMPLRGHPDAVSVVVYSPDGSMIATADWSGNLKVWDAKTNRELASAKGHEKGVGSVVWSKDSRTLMAASWDGVVKTYHPKSLRAVQQVKLKIQGCHFIAIAPDLKRVLCGEGKYTMRTFDLPSGNELKTFASGTFHLRRGVFSPDGRKVASETCAHGEAVVYKMWDAESGAEYVGFKGDVGGHATTMGYSPNGELVAMGFEGGKLLIYPGK